MQLPYLEAWNPRQRRQKLLDGGVVTPPRWLPQVEGCDADSGNFPHT